MRATRAVVLVLGVVAGLSCRQSAGAGAAPPPATPPRSAGSSTTTLVDSAAIERARFVAEVAKTIAGRESQPAEQVYRNVTTLRGMPAGNVLRVIDIGFGRSLGVSCTHCHVAGEWERDDKPQKQIARDMWTMVRAINTEQLRKIPNLRSASPTVNCTTCHRGQTKPALDMGPAPNVPR